MGQLSHRPLHQRAAVMPIEIAKDDRQQAIESLMRYFAENMDEPIGNVSAGALLGFFWKRLARWCTTRRSPMCRSDG
jgi:hypothetical protein